MGIFYRKKAFHAGKKIRKNDFAPSEKYACYAPGDISDHLPIFVSTDVNVYDKNASSVNIEIRDMSKHNVNVLKDKLSKVDWDEVCENDNANVQYNKFMDKFQELFEGMYSQKSVLKKRHGKNKTPKVPCITFALLKCIQRKNRLYKKSIQKPTETNVYKYKMYRSRLNSLLRRAKKKLFQFSTG